MNQRFCFHALAPAGLTLIERLPIADERGFLERLFCAETLTAIGLRKPIMQMNRTLTRRKGTVRGMHFQSPPHAEVKIVSCLRGEVFDVAVDLRHGSPTFLQWHGEVLSGGNSRMLYIPEGFAHGFQTLVDDCEMLYLHTAPYVAAAEGGLAHTEPRIGVRWPLPASEMSPRDAAHLPLSPDYAGIQI
jgi:dTDP-4-dehydrorhamnose 3,5-epimerase